MKLCNVFLVLEYKGPLARSQNATDVTAVDQFVQGMEPVIQIDKDVADVVDFDEILRFKAEKLGLPSKIIRDKDQVAQMRQEKQKIMEEQQQAQQAQQTSEVAKNVSPLVRSLSEKGKPGSIMEKVAAGAGR